MNNPHDLDELMAQTRRLAALYKKTTQQTLPVTHELSRYDAKRLLNLAPADSNAIGVDYIGTCTALHNKTVQIKGRVVFSTTDETDRVAEINHEGDWQVILLVLLDESYETSHILALERADLLAHFGAKKAKWPLRLGLSKKLGTVIFERSTGNDTNQSI